MEQAVVVLLTAISGLLGALTVKLYRVSSGANGTSSLKVEVIATALQRENREHHKEAIEVLTKISETLTELRVDQATLLARSERRTS